MSTMKLASWSEDKEGDKPLVTEDGVPVQDYRITEAIREIKATYGDTVSVVRKAKRLLKFGSADDIDSAAFETIWAMDRDWETVSP